MSAWETLEKLLKSQDLSLTKLRVPVGFPPALEPVAGLESGDEQPVATLTAATTAAVSATRRRCFMLNSFVLASSTRGSGSGRCGRLWAAVLLTLPRRTLTRLERRHKT
jgi:hypothetical protein